MSTVEYGYRARRVSPKAGGRWAITHAAADLGAAEHRAAGAVTEEPGWESEVIWRDAAGPWRKYEGGTVEEKAAGEPHWHEIARSFLAGRLRGVSVTALHDHVGEVVGPGNGPGREEIRNWLLDGKARGEVEHPAFQVWRLVPKPAVPAWQDRMSRVLASVYPSWLSTRAWADLTRDEDGAILDAVDRGDLARWISEESAAGRIECGDGLVSSWRHVPQEKPEEEPQWRKAVRDVLLDAYPLAVTEHELHVKARNRGNAEDLSREELAVWLGRMAKRGLVIHPEFRRWKASETLLPEDEVPTQEELTRSRIHVGRRPWVGPGAPARQGKANAVSMSPDRALALAKASTRMAQHALNNDWAAFERALEQAVRMYADWAP